MIKLGLLLVTVCAISLAYECEHSSDYDWPNSSNCRYYYHCHNGVATEESCFILFRKFNPVTLHCDWAWKVDCSVSPTKPWEHTKRR